MFIMVWWKWYVCWWSWLDIKKLDGFIDEVREILFSNKLLSQERINRITEQIESRIEFVKKLKQTKKSDNGYEV